MIKRSSSHYLLNMLLMDVRGLQSAKLWDRFRVRVIVGGVCNSENMVLSDLGIDIPASVAHVSGTNHATHIRSGGGHV